MAALMPDRELVGLLLAGTPYDEIVALNERATGFRVSKAFISRQKSRLAAKFGVALPRSRRPQELIPWNVLSEHTWDPLRRLLDLEVRRRENEQAGHAVHALTLADEQALADFRALLGEDKVVDYDHSCGFHLVPRRSGLDRDVIRWPSPGQHLSGGARLSAIRWVS